MTNNQINHSLEQIKTLFVDCIGNEINRPNTSIQHIKEFTDAVISKLKVHTFFLPDSLSEFTEMVFKNAQVRDFVFCLRDRFLIELNGLGNGVPQYLIECLSGYGDRGDDNSSAKLSLIPDQIPEIIKMGLQGSPAEAAEILANNTFLIVPLMIYLSYDKLTAQTTP
jgi:hypothetical protein